MSDQAIAVVEPKALTAVEIRAQVNLIQEVMKGVMKENTHFGTLQGCPKPSLWQPGAEKLLVTFRIAPRRPIVEDLSTPDCIRYRVTREVESIHTGAFLGAGVGECSSDEEKYKWRAPVCDAEYEATPEDRRRLKWKRDGSSLKQIRTNPADVANTILKMADKRAYVAVTLKVTAASDIFTQDIEDLPEGLAQATEGQEAPAPIKPPVRASTAKPSDGGSTVTAVPTDYTTKPTANGGTKHGVKINGEWYSTFSDTDGDMLKQAAEMGVAVKVSFVIKGTYKNITAVELAA